MENPIAIQILYLQPKLPPSERPTIDSLTRKLTAALKNPKEQGSIVNGTFVPNLYSLGCYKCTCGKAIYASQDFRISDGLITNSVALHYAAYHRCEISKEEIFSIELALENEEEPSYSDLELQ